MLISPENMAIRNSLQQLEKRIEDMHSDFQRYYQGIEQKVPEWERLEADLLQFSRKKIYDLELSKQLDRVQYKFQNRKKIWLRWLEESHHLPSPPTASPGPS
jgi:DNA repair exonuclease SbcCD ATPase subunit